MSQTPRMVYAERNGAKPTPVNLRRREIPVIIVPGLCGTRLTDPKTGDMAWNPLGGPISGDPASFACDAVRMGQTSTPLVPDETHVFEYADDVETYARIKHIYNVLIELYGPLALHLDKLKGDNLAKYNCALKIYCCGYDWRQDVAKSAMRLAGVVEEALHETGAKKVILVAHSMGTFVSRYYCRALGGEKKVHQFFAMGAPFLGAPEAYQQAKLGPAGTYVKDIVEGVKHIAGGNATRDDYEVVVDDVAQGLDHMAFIGVQTALTGSLKKLTGMLGSLVFATSIGQGHFLTRAEGRYLARQLPGLFQNMPNGVFCTINKNWVFFDPMATGIRPAGFMVELPTVLEAILGSVTALMDFASGNPAHPAQHGAAKVKKLLAGDDGSTLTGEASRNKMTVPELFQAAAKLAETDPKKAEALIKELLAQGARSFMDARNYKFLYDDIYTGLMDVPQLRAVSATNLALFYQLDAALTVNYRDTEPLTAATLLRALMAPALAAVQGVTDLVHGSQGPSQRQDATKQLDAEKKANKPLTYLPPCTYAIYCDDLPTQAGLVLFPRASVSRDDSNLVKYQVLPGLDMALQSLINSGPTCSNIGDGTVPTFSAFPPPEYLSNPFAGQLKLSRAVHADIPTAPGVKEWIGTQIEDRISDFFND